MLPSLSRSLTGPIIIYEISAQTDNFDFSDQICPKRVFPVKNWKSEDCHWTLHIRISLGTKFQLKLIILAFWTKFAQKRIFLIQNKISKYYHWILHIWISVDTKFKLKLIILIFWTKFAQKWCFQSKTKKVNSIIEFCIFE